MPAIDHVLPRPRLIGYLDQITRHRLTVVTAGPGGGKTSAIRLWARARPDVRMSWLAPVDNEALVEALAALVGRPQSAGPSADDPARTAALAAEIAAALPPSLVLVVDEAQRIAPLTFGARLLEALCLHGGDNLHVVLISRSAAPFPVQRLRGLGHVFHVTAEHLAFTPEETRSLARTVLGEETGGLAEEVQRLTTGWPVAVRLALGWLSGLPAADRLSRLASVADPLFDYLVEEVLDHCDARTHAFLWATASLPWFTPDLCAAIGLEISREEISALAAQHILITPGGGGYVATTLVREFAGDAGRPQAAKAARWFEERGFVREALAVCAEPAHLVTMIERWSDKMLADGHPAELVRACHAVPAGSRTAAIDLAEGQARQVQGDWAGALECLRHADAAEPAVAWRTGMIHYHRGDYRAALAAFERGVVGDRATSDEGMLLAWTAGARWMFGDLGNAARLARRALEIASGCGDERVAACAHTALAMVAHDEGDRAGSERHSGLAIAAAENAGDLLVAVRALSNRASHRTEEARYAEALADLEQAVRRAELVGAPVNAAVALHNRAEALLGFGRLDEALTDFRQARDLLSQVGSDKQGHPLAGLGRVYLERGDLMRARTSYEDALNHAEQLNDVHLIQAVLAGLARIHAVDDPERAVDLADRAVATGGGSGEVGALLAAGWAWAEAGDRAKARSCAESARTAAASRRDRAAAAEALELAAIVAADTPQARRDLLLAAGEIWTEIGSRLGAARNAYARACLERAGVREAERELRRAGVRGPQHSGAGLLRAVTLLDHGAVRFCVLGEVRLSRNGRAVPAAEWQSRKARDLLAWLVCQRGRPVAREAAVEVLWPGEDPVGCANRLSVALSTVRSILDPQRTFGPGAFVRADKYAIQLDGLRVDVEEFLAAAAEALRAEDDDLLVAAEARYTGDVCEDSPYHGWLEPLREEARAVHQAVLRKIASRARRAGEHDTAIRYLLRLLERDAYDEAAHLDLTLTLIRARRHGEARRRYRIYVEAMADLGVEPAPMPSDALPSAVGG
ncbi:tetratricopeptide repeat protein [Nonomuraea typhae]|uniref:tetratricopeptide repeat protein n=1 Tax=Nonomuraea typhae TaxID=2603600 RepID=UPI0012FA494D|nr:tetratricopeptide repeat protein [Nonomuraea typhae]